MIRAILIDDEPLAVEVLGNDLKAYCPEVKVVATCNSAKEGLKAIKDHKPGLIFLDIEMPWMNGFEMLEVIENINFDVIFTTAYDQFAVQAFKISAIDYLLKPIDKEDLIGAVKKVVEKKDPHISKQHLDVLMQNMAPSGENQRVALPSKNGFEFVLMQDILYCEADGNYTYFYMADKKRRLISRPMKEVEKMLNDPSFCRIHNSYLINLNQTQRYVRGDGGYVEMLDGTTLNVARSKKDELIAKISR